MASITPKTITISRRAFQKLSSTTTNSTNTNNNTNSKAYEQFRRLIEKRQKTRRETDAKNAASNRSKEETPWPRSMQIAGYAAVLLAIPYSMSVVVSESPRIQSYLQERTDDDDDDEGGGEVTTWGERVVKAVRWYWGEMEDVPYFEYLQHEKEEDRGEEVPVPYSFSNEVPLVVREEQEEIHRLNRKDVRVHFSMIPNDGSGGSEVMERVETLHGSSFLSSGEDGSDRSHILSFDDLNDDDDGGAADDDITMGTEGTGTDATNTTTTTMDFGIREKETTDVDHPEVRLRRLTATWSAWNHFPADGGNTSSHTNNNNNNNNYNNRSAIDRAKELQMEEFEYNISMLKSSLQDPNCTRDRDDMERELMELRGQLRGLKREVRWGRWKRRLVRN